MRGGLLKRFLKAERAAVAPTIGISLFALIGVGGIAFDYARLASMDSELQSAADHAALAAASQLDGLTGACSRAANAASRLIANDTRFSNDGTGLAVTIANEGTCDATGFVRFYKTKDKSVAATDDATANFVEVTVNAREAFYALTPVVEAFSSGDIDATAYAGCYEAICKNPPVMMCNPDEPDGNIDEDLAYSPQPGIGLRLVTGNATTPGNFGWLEAGLGNGASDLAAALGYNNPPGECQPQSGVTTKTGMDTAVLNAFNTRFDVYANGNMTCPGGTASCSPSLNTRKDLVCESSSGAQCNNDTWEEAANPYRGYVDPTTGELSTLPTTGSSDPDIMGYPHDLCHSLMPSQHTCGISGDGNWDRDAYFRVNYVWSHSQWTSYFSENVSRYDVYKWEVKNQNVSGNGIGVPQTLSGSKTAFGMPATGRTGINPLTSPIDRRRIAVAVLNCRALEVKGKTTDVYVAKWLDVFLVEPAFRRGTGTNLYTDTKDIYVEVISATEQNANGINNQVVQRSVPTLIE